MYQLNRTVIWFVSLLGILLVFELFFVEASRAQQVWTEPHETIPQQEFTTYFPLIAHPRPAPTIREPKADGQLVSSADVHMEASAGVEPVPQSATEIHTCSEWEIWDASAEERVWSTDCLGDSLKTHVHLGDGTFAGSHRGSKQLRFASDYRLQMRVYYGEGQDNSAWTPWSKRIFRTSQPTSALPLVVQAVLTNPQPVWTDGNGILIMSSAHHGTLVVSLESGIGEPLTQLSTQVGAAQAVTISTGLTSFVPVRVTLRSSNSEGSSIQLPSTQLHFSDKTGSSQTVYLPSLTLNPDSLYVFWVSATGDTYWGTSEQNVPDFTSVAQVAPMPWLVEQPGYKVSTFATGFQLPVNIAFAANPGNNPNDPYFYVTELYGTVKVVLRDGSVHDYASGLLNYNPFGGFPGAGEMGLTGIVVEPTSD